MNANKGLIPLCGFREELVLRQSDVIAVGFNGKGYFKGSNQMMRPKPYYNTVLSFKTLDEDALLFLAVNDVKVREGLAFLHMP